MNSIKTAFAVVVMLAVVYGVWTMLNKSPTPLPEGLSQAIGVQPDVQLGSEMQNSFGGSPAPEFRQPAPLATSNLQPMPTQAPPAGAAHDEHVQAPPSAMPAWDGHAGAPPNDLQPAPSFAGSQQQPPTQLASASRFSQPAPPAVESFDAGPQGLPGHAEQASYGSPQPQPQAMSIGAQAFANEWRKSQTLLNEGQLAVALDKLSMFYGSPEVAPEDHRQLVKLLDQLAGTVIYSQESLLEPAYVVRRGDTLHAIAQEHNVPMELLANINGVDNPDALIPGTQLKVVHGPFNAFVSLSQRELTLMLGSNYAGRFPIDTEGATQLHVEDSLVVRDKLPPGDPANKFGEYWIDLGGNLSIHGQRSPAARGPQSCIGVSPGDAKDLHSILSVGSRIVIKP